jgi:hypothetical protein
MDQQRVMLRRKRDRRGTFDHVKRRAYEIYEARGGAPGHALDDWLQAERELRANFGPLEFAHAVSQDNLCGGPKLVAWSTATAMNVPP